MDRNVMHQAESRGVSRQVRFGTTTLMGVTLSMQKFLETPLVAQWKFPFVVNPRFCRRRATTLELTDNFWTHAVDANGYAVREVNSDRVLFRIMPVVDGEVSDGRTKWLVDEYGIPVAHTVPRDDPRASSYDVCLGKRSQLEPKPLTTVKIKFIPGKGDPLFAEVDDPHTGSKSRVGCNGMWRQRVAMLYLQRGRESQREPIAKVYRPTKHRRKKTDRDNVYHVETAIGVDVAFVLLICAAMDDSTAHFHKAMSMRCLGCKMK
ncbi:hypothetical protein PsorP6_010587 [Peronosclerospora sorghi]|uniref:Uncharacterized protein n=1 Tax=Peronosclerospora sorghi TaxID=230839 RepID=A0ACC0VV63_9STRA|nr:hypothetical protein PsorP6_010587 [Peronosclerospora sorghi]